MVYQSQLEIIFAKWMANGLKKNTFDGLKNFFKDFFKNHPNVELDIESSKPSDLFKYFEFEFKDLYQACPRTKPEKIRFLLTFFTKKNDMINYKSTSIVVKESKLRVDYYKIKQNKN